MGVRFKKRVATTQHKAEGGECGGSLLKKFRSAKGGNMNHIFHYISTEPLAAPCVSEGH